MTQWFELAVEVPSSLAETLSSLLFDQGTSGIESCDRAERTLLKAYFDAYPDVGALLRLCFALSRSQPSAPFELSTIRIDDQNWSENWKLHFTPIRIGELFFIHPPWIPPAEDESLAILIDPGMAFGTGQHATTRGCLTLIERHVARRHANVALDLGTGSGVLAIALAKLGIPEVWGLDNDPVARTCAAENVSANSVRVRLGVGLAEIDQCPDAIVANLYTDLLTGLAPQLAALLASGGVMICSGFIVSDEAKVQSAYAHHGLVVLDRIEEASWVSLAFEGGKS